MSPPLFTPCNHIYIYLDTSIFNHSFKWEHCRIRIFLYSRNWEHPPVIFGSWELTNTSFLQSKSLERCYMPAELSLAVRTLVIQSGRSLFLLSQILDFSLAVTFLAFYHQTKFYFTYLLKNYLFFYVFICF